MAQVAQHNEAMAVLPIAHLGEPLLREPARPVTAERLATPEVQRLIDDMIETMRAASGAGIAAPQVFEPLRIAVIEVRAPNPRYPYKPPIPLTVLVDPVLEALSEETFENYEGCLSVPNLRGLVRRHVGVRVRAMDRRGVPFEREVWGLSAGTYQHECDHLEGKLFVDRVEDSSTLCTWENFHRYHEADFARKARALVERFGS